MTTLPTGMPCWPVPDLPPATTVRGDITVDVAVVEAGLAGCVVARGCSSVSHPSGSPGRRGERPGHRTRRAADRSVDRRCRPALRGGRRPHESPDQRRERRRRGRPGAALCPWQCAAKALDRRAATYDMGIPSLAAIIDPIARNALQDNVLLILSGLLGSLRTPRVNRWNRRAAPGHCRPSPQDAGERGGVGSGTRP